MSLTSHLQQNRYYLIAPAISFICGVLGIVIVASEANGYVASMTFLLIFLVVLALSGILLLAGVIALAAEPHKKIGASLLLSAVLLFAGFLASGFVAKTFEIGAYREEPMISLIPDIGNKVIFKKDVSEEAISKFWEETISTERSDGRGYEHLPGIRGIARVVAENGHETLVLSYFPGATEEQISYIRKKIKASPIVEEYLENVDTSPPPTPAPAPTKKTSATSFTRG